MTALQPGTRIHYRTLGTGMIAEHICPPERRCDDEEESACYLVHRYRVDFATGCYRGTRRTVWVRDSEVIPDKTPSSDRPEQGRQDTRS